MYVLSMFPFFPKVDPPPYEAGLIADEFMLRKTSVAWGRAWERERVRQGLDTCLEASLRHSDCSLRVPGIHTI